MEDKYEVIRQEYVTAFVPPSFSSLGRKFGVGSAAISKACREQEWDEQRREWLSEREDRIKAYQDTLMEACYEVVTPSRVAKIVNSLLEKAENGDLYAIQQFCIVTGLKNILKISQDEPKSSVGLQMNGLNIDVKRLEKVVKGSGFLQG